MRKSGRVLCFFRLLREPIQHQRDKSGQRQVRAIRQVRRHLANLEKIGHGLFSVQGCRREFEYRELRKNEVQHLSQRTAGRLLMQLRQQAVQPTERLGMRTAPVCQALDFAVIQRLSFLQADQRGIRQPPHCRPEQPYQGDAVVRIVDAPENVDQVDHLLPAVKMFLSIDDVGNAMPPEGFQIVLGLSQFSKEERDMPGSKPAFRPPASPPCPAGRSKPDTISAICSASTRVAAAESKSPSSSDATNRSSTPGLRN